MPRPAVFFDRDNTLIANGDYLGEPDRVVLLPGAADAVARVRSLGFATVVVSNQSGIGRGMFTAADVRAVNERMDADLLAANAAAVIDRHEFCGHHPEASVEAYRGDHPRRKPQPGMLLDAAEALGLDLGRSWLIGDAPRDVEAGRRAGCRTILLRQPLESTSPAAEEEMTVEPDYVASSLEDAVDFIEMQLEHARPTVFATAETVGGVSDIDDDRPTIAHDDSVREHSVDDPVDEAEIVDGDVVDATGATQPSIEVAEVPTEPAADAPAVPDAASVTESAVVTNGHGVAAVSSRLGVMNEAITSSAPPAGTDRQTVMLLERVVEELRRANDPPQDFSVSRMLAGIVQGFAIAAMFGAMLARDNPSMFNTLIFVAIFLQAMVSSLVLMGR